MERVCTRERIERISQILSRFGAILQLFSRVTRIHTSQSVEVQSSKRVYRFLKVKNTRQSEEKKRERGKEKEENKRKKIFFYLISNYIDAWAKLELVYIEVI
jgi:hypothetical protein